MSSPDLGDRSYDLRSFSQADRDFIAETLNRLDESPVEELVERPLAYRARSRIFSRAILIASGGLMGFGLISRNAETLVGGAVLFALWMNTTAT